jgi:hypothetical protein
MVRGRISEPISEIGTDISRWPTEKHFTSYLTLAPKNKIFGGRLLSSRTQPSANRANEQQTCNDCHQRPSG